MASLLFTCPKTKYQASSGVGTDVESLRAAWREMLKVVCPHCGEEHHISVRGTFLDTALYDATCRLYRATWGEGA